MTVLQWDDMNYDDEEFTEFSEFEIKKNSKKKERRGTNKMRKQQRLKKGSPMSDEAYDLYSY